MPSTTGTLAAGTRRSRQEMAALARAAGLALGPAVALGLARFAYALLLPAMRTDLHWSYTQAGALNTANALGYFAGAIGGRGWPTR
ncbi:MAG: YbfB/YjiJ family MFS transporter [Acidimicrobiales bacterium]